MQISSLTKKYGSRLALNNINLQVESGEIVGLLGSNGAGKTTMLKCIMGMLPCSFEQLTVRGNCIKQSFHLAMQDIVLMSDKNMFYEHLSGFDNLYFFAKMYGKTKDNLYKIVEQVGLKDRIKDKVRSYSLGMTQRLSLARCLLISPKIIIMDEPFNGIDIVGVDFMIKTIREISQKDNTSFFISSHNLAEMQGLCTRFVLMKEGNIVGDVQNTDVLDIKSIYLEKMG